MDKAAKLRGTQTKPRTTPRAFPASLGRRGIESGGAGKGELHVRGAVEHKPLQVRDRILTSGKGGMAAWADDDGEISFCPCDPLLPGRCDQTWKYWPPRFSLSSCASNTRMTVCHKSRTSPPHLSPFRDSNTKQHDSKELQMQKATTRLGDQRPSSSLRQKPTG